MDAVRTCLGCRQRASRPSLMRVVAREGRVVVDETGTLPGRGAWLHPTPDCTASAERRRAFGRALRTTITDTSDLSRWAESRMDK